MASSRLRLFAIMLFAVSAASAFRAPQEATPESLIDQLAVDSADGKLHRFSLLETAIIAGGVVEQSQVDFVRAQFDQKLDDAKDRFDGMLMPADRPAMAFEYLHDRYLTGVYQADCSELHRTLEEGHFNCVTATILYRCVCQRAGVDVEVAAARGHVLCRLAGNPSQYIETTCPEWYRLDREQQHRRLSESLCLGDLRALSDVELIGKIFYNRGVAAIERRDFAQACELLDLARRFDRQDAAARENMLAALNNWALAECDAGQYATASQLILRGCAIDDTYPPLRANDLHVHQQWVKVLCQGKEFDKALDVVDQLLDRRPDANAFKVGRQAILELQAKMNLPNSNS